jgi:hypothetical protein
VLVADGPYWTISRLVVPPDALVMYFAVDLPGPGSYRTVLKLWSPEFYERGDVVYEDVITALTPDV